MKQELRNIYNFRNKEIKQLTFLLAILSAGVLTAGFLLGTMTGIMVLVWQRL